MVSGLRGFLGVVSQPGTLSHIEMGWVYDRGQKRAVQVITRMKNKTKCFMLFRELMDETLKELEIGIRELWKPKKLEVY